MIVAPIDGSYWVKEGVFLAGRNPLYMWDRKPEILIENLLSVGIDTFIDLTESHEFDGLSYVPLINKRKNNHIVQYFNYPILDFSTPSKQVMHEILNRIHTTLAEDRKIYLHCYAGLGRTGTVVGCYLVEKGLSGLDALAEIQRLRKLAGISAGESPQTKEQREFILNWKGTINQSIRMD